MAQTFLMENCNIELDHLTEIAQLWYSFSCQKSASNLIPYSSVKALQVEQDLNTISSLDIHTLISDILGTERNSGHNPPTPKF